MARGNGLRVCPTCERAFPPIIKVGGIRRQQMFDYIADHPEGVTVWQVINAVYADDPNGGPTGHNIVSVTVKQINDRLKSFGYSARIKSTNEGAGSRYLLVEESTC